MFVISVCAIHQPAIIRVANDSGGVTVSNIFFLAQGQVFSVFCFLCQAFLFEPPTLSE